LSGLSDVDACKVRVGNDLVEITCRIIDMCRACNIPVTVENPRRSRLWWCPCVLRQLRFGHKVNMDLCAYEVEWKKATTFAVWNARTFDPLGITCVGFYRKPSNFQGQHRQKIEWCCGFSKKPHRILKGSAPGGLNWTVIAQAYPHDLARQYAKLANRGFMNRHIHNGTANLCARVHLKPWLVFFLNGGVWIGRILRYFVCLDHRCLRRYVSYRWAGRKCVLVRQLDELSLLLYPMRDHVYISSAVAILLSSTPNLSAQCHLPFFE
jgi:hypothetical protein